MRNKPDSRKLKKNELTKHPNLFCFVDTETLLQKKDDNITKHIFRLGVAIFVRFRKDTKKPTINTLYFTDINEFWSMVDNYITGKNTLHIIAHNALFDMTVLHFITNLTNMGYECKFVFEEGLRFISKWQKSDRRIMILDNSNWFPGKLEKWGELLDLPKMAMPAFEENNETWFKYCYRDTEILYKLQLWLINFIVKNNLGNWKYTLASLAFNSYRHRFMHHPIYIPDETRETFLARNSYRGGRTECFYSGFAKKGPFFKLDINSMYPAMMLEKEFPTSVEGYTNNITITQLHKGLEKFCAIGRFTVNVNEPYFPYKINDKTCYPVGIFDCFLSTPEIELALENNWIIKIHEIAWYRKRNIFKQFVEYFYNQRMKYKQSGDDLRSYMFKIILNSLYGKFGQRGFDDRIIGQAEPGTVPTSYYYDKITGKRGMIRQIGTNVIESIKDGEGHNAFVAIASHVTAYARVYLYSLITQANRNNVYYCDTDSVIVNRDGFNRLHTMINSEQIGKLKIEGESEAIEIIAPKHYQFGEEWKIKGVSKSAKQLGAFTYEQEIWPKFNKILGHSGEGYFNYTIVKQLKARVSSGTVLPDGRVIPYLIKD